MSILEAASVHVPLLLRDLPEYKNILTGRYMIANTNEEFAEAIRKIRSDASILEDLRAKSADISEQYSEEHTYELWKQFYESCLNKRELS